MFAMFHRNQIENFSKDSRYRILIIFFLNEDADELSKDILFMLINLFQKKLISHLIFVN